MNVGSNIRYYRKKAGLKAYELAEILGVVSNAVSKWETEKTRVPSKRISDIAKALSIQEQDLFSPVPLTLGEKIAKARNRKGITQKTMAELSGLSFSMISKIESGEQSNPSYETINRIASALGISIQELFVGSIEGINQEREVELNNLTTEQLQELIIRATNELARRIK